MRRRSTPPFLYALLLATGCGGASQAQTGPSTGTPAATASATATESVPPAATAAASDPAPASTEAAADSSDDATASSNDDEKLDPLAAPAKYKGADKPLPNLLLSVSVPTTAVIEAEGTDAATVSPEGHKGYGIMTIRSRSVLFEPLDKELAELDKQHLKVVSKRGSGETYAIVYKPYPNMFTYERFFTLGGKDMECLVEGLYHRDEIPIYDAICKSARAKKK
jgi:hypothetical protein